jgi:hypothetical protein
MNPHIFGVDKTKMLKRGQKKHLYKPLSKGEGLG